MSGKEILDDQDTQPLNSVLANLAIRVETASTQRTVSRWQVMEMNLMQLSALNADIIAGKVIETPELSAAIDAREADLMRHK